MTNARSFKKQRSRLIWVEFDGFCRLDFWGTRLVASWEEDTRCVSFCIFKTIKELSTSWNSYLIESIDISYSRCLAKYRNVLHLLSNWSHVIGKYTHFYFATCGWKIKQMAQNPKENFGPQRISLDAAILETSTALETGLRYLVCTGEYRRLLTTKLLRAAQVIITCV